MRSLVSLVFILLMVGCSVDQEQTRGFNDQRLVELKQTNQFNYDQIIEAYNASDNPILNIFGKVLQAIVWFLSNLFGYIVIVSLLILAIWFIISRHKVGPNENKPPEETIRSFDHEKLAEIDFLPIIEQALKDGDYRSAIRYSFLNTLKGLNVNKQITLKDSKTNHQYYYELEPQLRGGYMSLLRTFEFVWYGEFPATRALYAEADTDSVNLLTHAKQAQNV